MEIFAIILNDLHFHSRIGLFEQERVVGNDFVVNLEVKTSATPFKEECIDSTISYAEVFGIVKKIMDDEWKLLESVVRRIAREIKNQWPEVLSVKVSAEKLAPPISGFNGSAIVVYESS